MLRKAVSAGSLSFDDRGQLTQQLYGLGHRLSEYSFANLYLFQQVHRYRLEPGPLPCVSGLTYDGHRHLLPLFDLSQHAPESLKARLAGHDFYYPVSESMAERLAPDDFELWSNPDDSDYLYSSVKMAAYTGAVLHKKANLARQFERIATPSFDELWPARQASAHAVLELWLEESGKTAATTDYAACRFAIDHGPALGLQGHIAYASAVEPVGFLMFSQVWPDTIAIHFAKGTRRHVGVYPYMFQQLAKRVSHLYSHLNFEQDLGNPGFRQNKRSFAPLQQLHKLRVRPR